MKKIFIVCLSIFSQFGFSQTGIDHIKDTVSIVPNDAVVKPYNEVLTKKNDAVTNKNLIKLNLFALAVGNFSLQYERLITPKTAVVLSAGITPERGIPFYSSFRNEIDNDDTREQLSGLKYSNFAITPEIRFYLGSEGYKGFYIGIFGRYTSYDVKFPLQYDNLAANIPDIPSEMIPKDKIDLDGTIRAFSGGITLGAQWKLSNKLYLDWLIVGPHFGGSTGNIKGHKNLTSQEQQEIRDAISGLDIPMLDYTYEVDDTGARMKFDGPWAGIRSSLGLGYRF